VIEELRAEISRLRDKLTDKNFTKTPEREDVLQMEVQMCMFVKRKVVQIRLLGTICIRVYILIAKWKRMS
jgi:hypothetical protein